jgi:hypothetical protein
MTRSHGLPLNWLLSIEQRLTRVEMDVDHLKKTTAQPAPSRSWSPRDYVMAGAGIALVIAAALDKVPWSLVATLASSPN